MASAQPSPVTVFFDVDHTLTRTGSLESFLYFYSQTPAGRSIAARIEPLLEFAATATDLDEVHQAYARAFRGESWATLRDAGHVWHASVRASLYRESTVAALRSHQERGDQVVFVSGSWAPCLEPIALDLGVSTIVQSVPGLEGDGDTLDGAFDVMMLGSRKAVAVRAHSIEVGADLAEAYAYADHHTDEAFLRIVGNAVVVGEDPRLLEAAASSGWRVLK